MRSDAGAIPMTWKDIFRAALVEVDPEKLMILVNEAELAMMARSKSLPVISNEELLAISDATSTLGILKRAVRVQHSAT